jgi:predicted dithiol-disulfide oxidoreductase (DUF899 family)
MAEGARGLACSREGAHPVERLAERRAPPLPIVEITKPYTFDTEAGPASSLDLFDGRKQLIVEHFMFAPIGKRAATAVP